MGLDNLFEGLIDFRCNSCPAMLASESGGEEKHFFGRTCPNRVVIDYLIEVSGCRKGEPKQDMLVSVEGVDHFIDLVAEEPDQVDHLSE